MASATPDLRLPSQPQGITAHWLVPKGEGRADGMHPMLRMIEGPDAAPAQ